MFSLESIMEQIYLIVIVGLLVVGVVLLAVLKPDWAKKYWGYIAAAAAGLVAAAWALGSFSKRDPGPDPEMEKKEKRLREDLNTLHEEAEAEIQAAIEKEEEVKKEVEEIKNIEDDEERLNRLANLFNRTRR